MKSIASKRQKRRKVALITGITGQDGSYLTELLISKGYIVHGVVRRSSSFNRGRIEHLYDHEDRGDLKLYYGDLTDFASLFSIISSTRPNEIYNLGAQSHVQVSFETPIYTAQSDAIGFLNILEVVRQLGLHTKIYQASTSEMFSGDPRECPQDENTPLNPRSPYGVAKLYAHHVARVYRESYNMFIVTGILFNHESERRGESFVTRKITIGISEIQHGTREMIHIGNLDAKRDWGHAEDYVRAMYLMLQQKTPKDYVVATGEQHSVREFCTLAFKEAGVDLIWKGHGVDEIGVDKKTGRTLVKVDPKFFRPNEVWSLMGDARRARKELGWKPEVSFKDLIKRMVHSDLARE